MVDTTAGSHWKGSTASSTSIATATTGSIISVVAAMTFMNVIMRVAATATTTIVKIHSSLK